MGGKLRGAHTGSQYLGAQLSGLTSNFQGKTKVLVHMTIFSFHFEHVGDFEIAEK